MVGNQKVDFVLGRSRQTQNPSELTQDEWVDIITEILGVFDTQDQEGFRGLRQIIDSQPSQHFVRLSSRFPKDFDPPVERNETFLVCTHLRLRPSWDRWPMQEENGTPKMAEQKILLLSRSKMFYLLEATWSRGIKDTSEDHWMRLEELNLTHVSLSYILTQFPLVATGIEILVSFRNEFSRIARTAKNKADTKKKKDEYVRDTLFRLGHPF